MPIYWFTYLRKIMYLQTLHRKSKQRSLNVGLKIVKCSSEEFQGAEWEEIHT